MKDDIEFLRKLQHTLQHQETDVQASPRFWVLMDYRTVPTADDYAETYEIYDRDVAESVNINVLVRDTKDEIKAAIEQGEPDPITEYYKDNTVTESGNDLINTHGATLHGALNAADEISCVYSALDWIVDYAIAMDTVSENVELIPVMKESYIVPNTMFITKQDAKDYIKRYRYNHSPEVHTYAMTALRSPSVERLLNILETFNWDAFNPNTDYEGDPSNARIQQ